MDFRIKSTDNFTNELLLNEYPILSKYNVRVIDRHVYVTINTVEDLMKLIEDVENPIIIDDGCCKNACIEIYDGYRE